MRVVIPKFKTKKELFSHLKANKKELLKQKCLAPIKTDNFDYGYLEIKSNDLSKIGSSVSKTKTINEKLGPNEVQVDAIANMAGWCDSHMDVLIPDCWKKTIKEKGSSNKQLIYHLKNHNYTTDAIIGKGVMMRSEYLDLSLFNITNSALKQGQALIGASTVKKDYDKKCYHLYLDDEIKQHSIGLRYIKLYLCINLEDEDYEAEKANWDKYIKYVINKDKVEGKGFFWAVTEIKLLEYSAVLFGSNELTTVQDTSKEEKVEPAEPIQPMEPAKSIPINYDYLTEQL